jgi:DNA-binding MarR family transcriptional regulator
VSTLEEIVEETTDEVLYASRALLAVAVRSLAASEVDVTIVQYRTLVVLAGSAPLSLTKLATELGLQPSTASRLCDRLITKGLITRARSRTSGRSIEIALSPAGAKVVRDVLEARRIALTGILAKLTPEQQRTVREAFTLFAEASGEPRPLPGASHWIL